METHGKHGGYGLPSLVDVTRTPDAAEFTALLPDAGCPRENSWQHFLSEHCTSPSFNVPAGSARSTPNNPLSVGPLLESGGPRDSPTKESPVRPAPRGTGLPVSVNWKKDSVNPLSSSARHRAAVAPLGQSARSPAAQFGCADLSNSTRKGFSSQRLGSFGKKQAAVGGTPTKGGRKSKSEEQKYHAMIPSMRRGSKPRRISLLKTTSFKLAEFGCASPSHFESPSAPPQLWKSGRSHVSHVSHTGSHTGSHPDPRRSRRNDGAENAKRRPSSGKRRLSDESVVSLSVGTAWRYGGGSDAGESFRVESWQAPSTGRDEEGGIFPLCATTSQLSLAAAAETLPKAGAVRSTKNKSLVRSQLAKTSFTNISTSFHKGDSHNESGSEFSEFSPQQRALTRQGSRRQTPARRREGFSVLAALEGQGVGAGLAHDMQTLYLAHQTLQGLPGLADEMVKGTEDLRRSSFCGRCDAKVWVDGQPDRKDAYAQNGLTSFAILSGGYIMMSIEGKDEELHQELNSLRTDSNISELVVMELSRVPRRLFSSQEVDFIWIKDGDTSIINEPDINQSLRRMARWFPPGALSIVMPTCDDCDDSSGSESRRQTLAQGRRSVDARRSGTQYKGSLNQLEAETRALWCEKVDRRWHPVVLMVVLYYLFVVPIAVGSDTPLGFPLALLSSVLPAVWWVEMALRAYRPRTQAGILDSDPWASWRSYVRGSFLWDFVAGFPLGLVGLVVTMASGGEVTTSNRRVTGSLHPLWLLNTLLLARDVDGFARWVLNAMDVPPRIARIIMSFGLFAGVCHIMGCIWLWVIHTEGELSNAWHGYTEIWDVSWWHQYLIALDQAIKQMSGLSKTGMPIPQTDLETFFAVAVAFVGVALFSAVIATVGSLVTERISEEEKLQDRLDRAYDTFKYLALPAPFIQEAKSFLVHTAKQQRKLVSVTDILGDLHCSIALRLETLVGGDTIKKMPMFAQASEDPRFLHFMLSGLEPRTFCAGEDVMVKGDEGDEMFFVVCGDTVVVGDKGIVLAVVGPGSFFGEIALLNACRRTATIRAKTHCSCLRLGREIFEEAEELFPDSIRTVRAHAESRLQKIKLAEIVENTSIFEDFAEDTDFIGEIVGRMKPIVCAPRTVLITEGTVGTDMYFVGKGELAVIDADGDQVGSLTVGDYFGDMSIVYNIRSTATVVAVKYTDVYVLSRADFEEIKQMYPTQSRFISDLARNNFQQYALVDIISKVPLFQTSSPEFAAALVSTLQPLEMEEGSVVCSEGAAGEEMYFVSRGTLNVTVGGATVAQLNESTFFGEICLFFDSPRTATIVTASFTELFVLSKQDFEASIAPQFPDEVQTIANVAKERMYASKLTAVLRKVPLFDGIQKHNAVLEALCSSLRMLEIPAGEVILEEGDLGDAMIIVFKGCLESVAGDKRIMFEEESFLCADSLIWHLPVPHSVRTREDTTIFVLEARAYSEVVDRFREHNASFSESRNQCQKRILRDSLQSLTMFKAASTEDDFQSAVDALVERMEAKRLRKHEKVVEVADAATGMFIVGIGAIRCLATAGGLEEVYHTDGMCVDDVMLVYPSFRRQRTVVVTSQTVCLYFLSRQAFEDVEKQFRAVFAKIRNAARALYENEVIVDILKRVPFLAKAAGRNSDFLPALVKHCSSKRIDPMQRAYSQGEIHDWMVLVKSGQLNSSADVKQDFRTPDMMQDCGKTLGPGDHCGEMSMMFGVPNVFSVVACTECDIFVLNAEFLTVLEPAFPLEVAATRRYALQEYRSSAVLSLIIDMPLFSSYRNDLFVRAVVGAVTPIGYRSGTEIAGVGSESSGLLVVRSGSMEHAVLMESEGAATADSDRGGWGRLRETTECFQQISPGESFGAHYLYYEAPYPTKLRSAVSSVEVCSISREDWRSLSAGFPEISADIHAKLRTAFQKEALPLCLHHHPFFDGLAQNYRSFFVKDIAEAMQSEVIEARTILLEKGDEVSSMYFVARGALETIREERGRGFFGGTKAARKVVVKPGQFFGGVGLLRQAFAPSSVIAASDVELFVLTKERFRELLTTKWGDVESSEKLERNFAGLVEASIQSGWMPRPEPPTSGMSGTMKDWSAVSRVTSTSMQREQQGGSWLAKERLSKKAPSHFNMAAEILLRNFERQAIIWCFTKWRSWLSVNPARRLMLPARRGSEVGTNVDGLATPCREPQRASEVGIDFEGLVACTGRESARDSVFTGSVKAGSVKENML
eukprot:Hpha_TRINITY_DN12725_c0_g1::TRINITY_DN12725_c0_g1_i1::g.114133::m.114133